MSAMNEIATTAERIAFRAALEKVNKTFDYFAHKPIGEGDVEMRRKITVDAKNGGEILPVELPLIGGGKLAIGIYRRDESVETLELGLIDQNPKGDLTNYGQTDIGYFSYNEEQEALIRALARLKLDKDDNDLDREKLKELSELQRWVLEKLGINL